MHELAIAEGLVDAVTERLPGTKISEVRLEIGALSGVVPDSLRFCFDLATEGTDAGRRQPADHRARDPVECRTCGDTFVPDGARRLGRPRRADPALPVRQRRRQGPVRPATHHHLGKGGLNMCATCGCTVDFDEPGDLGELGELAGLNTATTTTTTTATTMATSTRTTTAAR